MSRFRMPSVFFSLPALLLSAVAAHGLTVKAGCKESCGGVDIPYPFGIGASCFLPGFEILCSSNTSYLAGKTTLSSGIRVLSLSVMPRPEVRVLLPVAFQCFTAAPATPSASGPTGRYKYSYYAGCVAFCNDSRSARDGACAGVGCCRVDIPPGLTGNSMHLQESVGTWSHINQEFSPCDYAFIVEKGAYQFKVDDLTKMPTTQAMPMRLDWAIQDSDIQSTGSMYTCAQVVNKTGYTCVSNNSECVDSTNGPGYICNCTAGYEGNPYLLNGCKRLTFGVSSVIVAILTTVIKLERSKRKELFRKNGGAPAVEDPDTLFLLEMP
ncbi:hypothetical protein ACQ4PT_057978 [Festuca glaucescens]